MSKRFLTNALFPILTLGALTSGSTFGSYESGVLSRERKFGSGPKRVGTAKKGYEHKERTPEEKRAKYLHKLKIKERRQRKGCRKGGRI